ncbi:ROK family transcriptional regulator [Streptomyces sp. NPDC018584]|uniref:ROK family transcriptional regulator n=1 Tax=unclassified Streptomyces TaxID=2593676 RepID=UPI0037AC53BE
MRNPARGHDLVALRRLDNTVVLRAPSRRSLRTRAERAAGSGLPQSSVEATVEEATGRGLTDESTATGAAGDHPPGRPTRRLHFRAEAGRVLGVDVGLHTTLLLPACLGDAALAAQRAQHNRKLPDSSRLDGVVSAGGAVTCVEVPERSGVDLGRLLSDGGAGRTRVENDVHLAVLAERQGATTLTDATVCVLTGYRVACGLLIGAGSLGVSVACKALRRPGARWVGEVGVAVPARGADAAGSAVFVAVAGRLTPCVAAPALAVDPELTVLTGGATPAGRHPVPLLQERLRPVTPHVPRIALSSLGERGVALGAVRKALDHVEEELLADTAP